jgi:hypothetical protein
MSDWTVGRRLATFGVGLLVAFGAGFGIGELGDPIDRQEPVRHDAEPHDTDPAPAPSTSTTASPYAHQHNHFGGGG